MEYFRPLDGLEFLLLNMFLSIEDTFTPNNIQEWTIEYLRNQMKILSINYNIFNYVVSIDENNHMHWNKKEINLEEFPIAIVDWQADQTKEEIIPINFEPNKPLYQIKVSLKQNSVKLEVIVSHSISDGRTIANYFYLISQIFSGIEIDQILEHFPPERCSFKSENFHKPKNYIMYDKIKNTQLLCKDIKEKLIHPKLKNFPKFLINEYISYPLEQIKNFCKKTTNSISGVLMAGVYRAFRKFNKINDDLYANILIDTRKTSYANDYLKRRLLFCGANSCIIKVKHSINDSIDEDIKFCSEATKAAFNAPDAVLYMNLLSNCINEKTLDFTFTKEIPNLSLCPIFTASNIGFYDLINPKFKIYSGTSEFYTTPIYGYYNKSNLFITLIYPDTVNMNFINTIKETINEVINYTFG